MKKKKKNRLAKLEQQIAEETRNCERRARSESARRSLLDKLFSAKEIDKTTWKKWRKDSLKSENEGLQRLQTLYEELEKEIVVGD